ncbi:hypothetical protein [Streptomyces sp. NBC_01235]|uniref:hypothetical protein n=1 Tax=Streptomyces sp. NBC_01235 TaxID=2903788 RepID=UPI002E0EF8C1|nr:hypothetical protein OG289_27870 [Streptomyces sp. NBC_01235]
MAAPVPAAHVAHREPRPPLDVPADEGRAAEIAERSGVTLVRLTAGPRRSRRSGGTGLLFMVSSLAFVSWTPFVLGLGITVTGHVVKPTG